MNKPRALETEHFSIGARLGNMKRGSFTGYLRESENLLYQETLFISGPQVLCSEGSGNWHLSPYGPRWGTWNRLRESLKTERLCLWGQCEGNWREGYFIGEPGGCIELEGGLLYWGAWRMY
jgi:hypothetical protein